MDGERQSILMDLLKDRKYTITEISAEKWTVFSEAEKKNKEMFLFTQQEYWDVSLKEVSRDKAQNVANDFMRKCLQEAKEDDCIIVCPQVLFAVCSSYEDDYLEVISEQTISFNPIENENVPRHTFFRKSKPGEFYPIISVNDPIARWYGFKKGDVVKIEREYCGETYYRMVSS